MLASLGTVSLGIKSGNQKHPRKVQLASLKYSWLPRNQRHPETPPISAKTRNCNDILSSEMGKIVWKNRETVLKKKNWSERAENIIISCLLQVKNRN